MLQRNPNLALTYTKFVGGTQNQDASKNNYSIYCPRCQNPFVYFIKKGGLKRRQEDE
jgi:hypothetical protein